jgi:hypothetical protein
MKDFGPLKSLPNGLLTLDWEQTYDDNHTLSSRERIWPLLPKSITKLRVVSSRSDGCTPLPSDFGPHLRDLYLELDGFYDDELDPDSSEQETPNVLSTRYWDQLPKLEKLYLYWRDIGTVSAQRDVPSSSV